MGNLGNIKDLIYKKSEVQLGGETGGISEAQMAEQRYQQITQQNPSDFPDTESVEKMEHLVVLLRNFIDLNGITPQDILVAVKYMDLDFANPK